MPRITLRDHKVHYQQTGSGADVVLVHGLSCNIAFWWFHVAQHLALTHRVTAVDLRGHGFSGMTETGYRACDLAGDLAALLDHLDIRRAHLVAHSFGGAVAVALAAERPDLVSELTLADAWLPSLQPVPPLPGAGDWAATRARAQAAGVEIDPHLPLVVRELYSELLDENEFQSGRADRRDLGSAGKGWDVPTPDNPGFRENGGGEPRQAGAFWPRSMGGGRGLWAGRGGRWFGRGAEGPVQRQPAPAPKTGSDALTTAALEGAIVMAGRPGKPSQGVKRWQELMARTHARAEFLDVTSIEAPAVKDITAPVRLIYGSRSHYRQTAEALENLLPQSKLQIVPRAAHFFPLLRPQALLQALSEPIEHISRPGGFLGQRLGKSGPNLRLIASQPTAGPVPTPHFPAAATGTDHQAANPPASGAPRA